MTGVPAACFVESCIVSVHGPLRLPISHDLRHSVQQLLSGGHREIVLDLGRVSRIDAAGVGELVRAYKMTMAAEGLLRIVHADGWVQEILELAGLFDLLTAEAEAA